MQEDTTTDPVVADIRNFYKVEVWTRHDFIEIERSFHKMLM